MTFQESWLGKRKLCRGKGGGFTFPLFMRLRSDCLCHEIVHLRLIVFESLGKCEENLIKCPKVTQELRRVRKLKV